MPCTRIKGIVVQCDLGNETVAEDKTSLKLGPCSWHCYSTLVAISLNEIPPIANLILKTLL